MPRKQIKRFGNHIFSLYKVCTFKSEANKIAAELRQSGNWYARVQREVNFGPSIVWIRPKTKEVK